MEDKQKILDKLLETVKLTRAGMDITAMDLSGDMVIIRYDCGYTTLVNVECDSGAAMIRDVMDKIK